MIFNKKRKKTLIFILISYFIVNSLIWLISIVILDQNKMLKNFEKYDLIFKLSYIIPIFLVISYSLYLKIFFIYLYKKYNKYLLAKKYNKSYDFIKNIYLKTKDNNILLIYAISCCNINNYDEFELLYKSQTGNNIVLDCYKLFADFLNSKSIEVNEIEPLISNIKKYKNTDNLILLLNWVAYSILNDKRINSLMDIRLLKEAKFINPFFIKVSNKIIKETKNFDI